MGSGALKNSLFIDASNIRAGGGLTHLIELLRAANPLEVGLDEVIVAAPDSTLRQLDEKPWLTRHAHPYLNRSYLFRFWWQFRILPGLVRSREAILFIPGTGKPWFKYPYVTMCRNLLPLDFKELWRFGLSLTTLRLLFLRVLHLNAYAQAQGVIFLTQYCVDILPVSVRARIKKRVVIPHGLNHKLFTGNPERSDSTGFNLLYVSIVNWYKHQDQVARAVINLNKKGYPVRLTLIGPAYKPALRKLNRVMAGHEHLVTYKGKIPYEQLTKEYRGHHAFIMASTCETFCMILTEAMAMGMAIACSYRSSLPETLGDAGVYFDPEQLSSVEQAILQLYLNATLREELAQRALSRSAGYDWAVCSKNTFEFLALSASPQTVS